MVVRLIVYGSVLLSFLFSSMCIEDRKYSFMEPKIKNIVENLAIFFMILALSLCWFMKKN